MPFNNIISGSALCCQCSGIIENLEESLQAMGMIFHNRCFTCSCCFQQLKGEMFYKDHGKLYCEQDYMYCGFQQNLERCFTCGHMITSKVLRGLDKSYHVECFRCVTCNECLDGVPFTVGTDNKIYCIRDYYLVNCKPCTACGQPFVPEKDSFVVKSVMALNKDFHSECFVCEDCNINLAGEHDNMFCPRYDSIGNVHLFCRKCFYNRPGSTNSSVSQHGNGSKITKSLTNTSSLSSASSSSSPSSVSLVTRSNNKYN